MDSNINEESTKVYYLIVNDEVFLHTTDLNEAIKHITWMGMHTRFYGDKIDSEKSFWEYFDWHSGIRSSCDELLDSQDNVADVYIIEEFYVNQYPEILDIVNEYRKVGGMEPLKKASDM